MAYNAGASSGNLVLIQKQTASASALLEFKNIPATYDNLKLLMYGVTSSGTSALRGQYSYDNGSTYKSDAAYVIGLSQSTSGGSGNNWASGQTNFTLIVDINNTASCQACGEANFYNVATSIYPVMTTTTQTVGNGYSFFTAGCTYNGAAGIVNAFSIFPDAGTFSGTFKLYGIVN